MWRAKRGGWGGGRAVRVGWGWGGARTHATRTRTHAQTMQSTFFPPPWHDTTCTVRPFAAPAPAPHRSKHASNGLRAPRVHHRCNHPCTAPHLYTLLRPPPVSSRSSTSTSPSSRPTTMLFMPVLVKSTPLYTARMAPSLRGLGSTKPWRAVSASRSSCTSVPGWGPGRRWASRGCACL